MKPVLFSFVFLFIFFSCHRDLPQAARHPSNVAPLWNDYDRYKEPLITNRFFKHSDIVPLIEKHAASGMFRHEVLGASVQGRSIHHLTLGHGPVKILLWSQMHGDESTATMALFDLFNFFEAHDTYDSLRDLILSATELHFVPMLNPDGAEVWQRRNALDIDINRDARLLATPEGRILTNIGKSLAPAFGFNLHDQSIYYTAGATGQPATISFLAPAYNYEKDMNDVRRNAIRVIVAMNHALQETIPGKVARYDDAHDPRCFGDTFQGWGTAAILIESGGYPGDVEKQYIRKVNFYALLAALESIATGSYTHEDTGAYAPIPENSRYLYNLVVRNLQVEKDGQSFKTHLGINRAQVKRADYRHVDFHGVIEEIGDLDRQFGYEEVDATSMTYAAGGVRAMTRAAWDALTPADELTLLRQGILFVRWTDGEIPKGPVSDRLLNLAHKQSDDVPKAPELGRAADFLLMSGDTPRYAVVNGFLIDLENDTPVVSNTYGY